MGASWVPVRDAVAAGTLRASDKGAAEVAARFDALLRYVSLQLGRTLGTEVVPLISRKEQAEPALRGAALVDSIVREGRLAGGVRIPNAAAPLNVEVDLRAGRVTCHVDIDAPREGRPTTRVNWLVRQLKGAPEGLRVEAFAAHGRGTSTAALLKDLRDDSSLLLPDPKKELKTFRVALSVPLGTKRGRGRGAAIDSVLAAVDTFYGEVLQHLKPWAATPPKMRDATDPPTDVRPALVSTALSSQDGIEGTDGAATSTEPSDGSLLGPSAAASEANTVAASD